MSGGMLRVELAGGFALRSDLVSGTTRSAGDEETTAWTAELGGELALDEHWSLSAGLPMAIVVLRSPKNERPAVVAGAGDMRLGGRYAYRWERWSFGINAGLTLPTGRSVGDPGIGSGTFAAQLGTGVVVPVLSLDGAVGWFDDAMRASAFVEGRWVPGANSDGYHTGSSLRGGLGLHYTIKKAGLTVSANGNISWRAGDEDLLPPPMGAPETGGAWLSVGPGLTWAPGWGALQGFAVHASGGYAVWQWVQGSQLAERFSVVASLSYTGRVFTPKKKADHDHGDEDGHDHGDEHSDEHGDTDGHERGHKPDKTHTPDVADAVADGRAFILADILVPGKVTILDFWAEWCVPCKYLDEALRELAAGNPRIAIRRINIVEPESPAGRVLGGEGLPRVRVYGPSGKLLRETGFDMPAIEAAVGVALAD